MAAKAVGNEVFDAIARAVEAFAGTTDFAALEFALAQGAEVLFESSQAVRPQGGGPIDVPEAARRPRFGRAQNHSALELIGPHREPVFATPGALPQFLPLCQLDSRPLHHAVIVDPRP